MKPKHLRFRSRSFPSLVNFSFGFVSPMLGVTAALTLLSGSVADGANVVHSTSSATTNWSTAVWSPVVSDWTTTAGDVASFAGTTVNTYTLDTNVTIGGIRHTGSSGRTVTGASPFNTIVLDGTGLLAANQSFGNDGVAYLANANGNASASRNLSFNGLTLNMMTDLDIGITSGTGSALSLGGTGGILNNISGSAKTVTFRNNSTAGSAAINVNYGIGIGGNSTLSLVNSGTGNKLVTLSGTIGSNVTNITQNTTNSLLLSGDNATGFAAGTGTVNIINGTMTVTPAVATNVIFGAGNVITVGDLVNTTTAATLNFAATTAGTYTIAGINGTSALGSVTTTTGGIKTLTLAGSGSYSYAGVLSATTPANLALTVALGAGGSQTLTGANTYTGLTTINSGKLVNNGSLASAVTINTGGSLGGSGTFNALVTSNAGGAIDLRDNGVHTTTLTAGLTLTGGSSLYFDLDSTVSPATGADRLNITGGAYSFAGSGTISVNINVLGTGTIADGSTYTLISGAGGTINASNFASTPTPATIDGKTAVLKVSGGTLSLQVGSTGVGHDDVYWRGGDGSAAADWTNLANFSTNAAGTTPATLAVDGATNVHFSATTQGAAAVTATLDADQRVRSLILEANQTGDVIIDQSSPHKLTIVSGISTNAASGNLTINATEVGLASTQAWENNSTTKTVTVNSNITGVGSGLAFLGAGSFNLGGANTYDGGTTIGSGTSTTTVNLTGTGSLLSTGLVTINAGGTLAIGAHTGGTAIGSLNGAANGHISLGANTLTINQSVSNTFAGDISGTGGITKESAGTLTLTGASTYSGITQVNTGVLNIQNATALGTTAGGTTVAAGAALQIQSATTLVVGAEALTLNGTGISNDGALRNIAGTNTFGGAITLGSDARINALAGTLTLTGGISGAHALTVGGTAGTVVIDSILGSNVTSLTKDGTGSTLILAQNNTAFAGPVTITGGVLQLGNAGTTGSLNPASTISVASGATLRVNRTNTTVQGVDFASDISGAGGFTQAGTGTTILNAANTFTGATNVTGGILRITNAGALGTGAGNTVVTGGALELEGGITVAEALNLNSTTLRNHAGNNTWAGTIAVSFAATFASDADLLTVSGALSTNSGVRPLTFTGAGNILVSSNIGTSFSTITKNDTGTLTLTGTNTNTSTTTVNGGKLIVNGSLAATSPVVIGTAGSLGGTGTINGSVTTTTGGGSQINLQDNAIGTLTVGSLNLHAGDVLSFDLGNATADHIAIATGGTYSFTDAGTATVNLNAIDSLTQGTYDLITNAAGINATQFTLSNIAVGGKGASLISTSGNSLQVVLSDTFGDSTAYWNTAGTGDFVAGNFSSSVNGTGSVSLLGNATSVYFSSDPNAATAATANLTSGQLIKSLTVRSNHTQSVTIGGTGQLALFGDSSGSSTIGLTLEAGAGALTINTTGGVNVAGVQSWVNNSASLVTIDSVISGSALTLTGGAGNGGYVFSKSNTYSGGTAITGTKLSLVGAGSLLDSGAVSITANGIFDISNITADSETIGTLSGTTGSSIQLGAKTLIVTGNDVSTYAGDIAGTGGFTKQGIGSLTLSGNLSYSGTTTVEAGRLTILTSLASSTNTVIIGGTLAVGSGGTLSTTGTVNVGATGTLDISQSTGTTVGTLTGNGTVNLGAQTLTLNTTTNSAFDGVIADGGIINGTSGGLTKNGAATLTLTGANTYTGTTQINAGTLALTGTGSLTSALVNVGAAGTFTNSSGGLTSTSTLTNAGLVNQNSDDSIATFNNTGTLNGTGILTATTYNLNDGSAINAQLGAGTINANGLVAITNNTAANVVNIQTGITTLTGAERLADTADVTVTSGATLVLGGAETIGSLLGGGIVTNNTSLTVEDGTFVGSINGAGTLTKTSSGTLSLSGTNGYTGATTVSAGILEIAAGATLDTSGYTVNSGAILRNIAAINGPVNLSGTLTGAGSISGLVTANSGSTISLVDNAITTKTLSGGLIMANGSNLNLEIGTTLGSIDSLNLAGSTFSGSATINLNFSQLGGSNAIAQSGQYILISDAAAGTIDANDFTIASLGAGYSGTLSSDGTNLIIDLTTSSFVPYAETPNQIEIAQVLEEVAFNAGDYSSDFQTVLAEVQGTSNEVFQFALEQISPALHAGGLSTLTSLSKGTVGALHQSLNQRSLNSVDYSDPYAGDYQWDLWGQATGYYSEGGTSLIPGESFETGTFLAGLNRNLSHTTALGIFGGYGDGNADYDNGSKIDITRQFFGGYLNYVNGGFYANGSVGGGSFDYDSKRRIQIGGLDRTANASTDGEEFFVAVGGGYDFKFGDFRIGPQVSVQHSKVSLNSFSETGASSLNLALEDAEYTSLQSLVGGRIAYTIQTTSAFAIVPFVQAFWQHEFDDSQEDINASLDGGNGPSFKYFAEEVDSDSAVLGAGLSLDAGETFQTIFSYNHDTANGGSNLFSATVNWKF